jgi:ribonuclease HI
LAYIISDETNPTNHPIFALDTDLGSSLLNFTDTPGAPPKIRKRPIFYHEIPSPTTYVWKMFFDRASSSEGAGAGVVFVSPCQETISFSYKLEFETTNNVAEYEALVLGLRAAKEMGIEEVAVFRDAELIVQQVRNAYRVKHPRFRSYKNEVWDLIDNFFLAFNISFIPREENTLADSLVVSASQFRIPLPPKFKYDEDWKAFEDNIEIIKFLESVDEFFALHIDQDHDPKGDSHPEVFLNKISNHHIV